MRVWHEQYFHRYLTGSDSIHLVLCFRYLGLSSLPLVFGHTVSMAAGGFFILGGFAEGRAVGDVTLLSPPPNMAGWCSLVLNKSRCHVLHRTCGWCQTLDTPPHCLLPSDLAPTNSTCVPLHHSQQACPGRQDCGRHSNCLSCLQDTTCDYQ